MPDLILRARGSGEKPAWRDGHWVLETESEWLVEGLSEALDAVVEALPEHAERLASTVVLLSFHSAVGRFMVPGLGELELVSGKWTEAHFDHMLRELTEIAAALPFSRRIGSGLPYERVLLPERRVPYHAFVYLRYALSESTPIQDRLDLALRQVLARPYRRLAAADRMVPVERARTVGTRGLLRALTSPWLWRAVPSDIGGSLAAALEGHLPDRVEEDQRYQSPDTPENRFVRAFLDLCHTIIERTRAQVESWSQPALTQRVLRDCDRMARALAPVRAHALWREVGPMVQFPASSVVLQRRYGYREILKHFVRLRLVSRIPLDDQALEDLLSLKDIATLYELWCFFTVVRAVEQCLGPPSVAQTPEVSESQVTVPWGFRVAWPDGTEVLYNARFARESSRLSTSVPLRPDIALYVPAGPNRGLHLFDAKFRLQTLEGLDAEADEAASFKRADLYKMHAYRDAIPDAISVWVMYPGTEQVYFPALPLQQGIYNGVGVVPARPHANEVTLVIKGLLTTG